MYLPAHFRESDTDALVALMRDHPLGMLVRQGAQGLDADHLPFEVQVEDEGSGEEGAGSGENAGDASGGVSAASGRLRLLAHVARDNPLWRGVSDGDRVLVVFRGEHGYISPNWYPSKHEAHRQVPTWNYRVVHVHGRIAVRDDRKFLLGVVGRLTREHESRAGERHPWKMADAEREYLDEMVARIVGIEIAVERIEGKFKLSQNKETRDRQGAVEALASRGNAALARAMRQGLPVSGEDPHPER